MRGADTTLTPAEAGWVPMRWPCGPLDVETARRGAGGPAEADVVARWGDPQTLDLLRDTPVSCLVVTWAGGGPGDGAHQQALGSLVSEAHRRGLALVGWAGPNAELARAARTAEAAGLDGVATESTAPGPPGILRFRDRHSGDHSPAAFLGLTGALWPGIRVQAGSDIDAWSGPTGPAWIDSNTWAVRLARALVQPATLWLSFDPPADGSPVTAAAYARAIADSSVYGGRWVVSLDPGLRLGLLDGRAPAAETWAGIARALAFVDAHRAWGDYEPVGRLGVVSAFAGDDGFMSHEVLNLLARQGGFFRILEKDRAASAPWDGLEAILYVDVAGPGPELRRRLLAFAAEGGTLVTPPGWETMDASEDDAWVPRYRVFRHGRGRVAVAREEPVDPQRLAEDAQLLMSHRHDPVRLFNTMNAVPHYCTSPDGGTGVLHLVSWSGDRLRMPVTAWFRRPWAQGRIWRMDAPRPSSTERAVVEGGVEFYVRAAPVYSALEVSG